MVWTKRFFKIVLPSTLAAGFLLLSSVPAVRASDYESCHRNIEKWESRLDHDINRHGVYSRQADHDRHELAEAREDCERRYGNGWHGNHDFDHDGDRR